MSDLYYYGSGQQADDLRETSARLTNQLIAKEGSYKGSWQKRGGVGAFMMLARKADRIIPTWQKIEEASKENGYDIFKAWDALEALADSEMNDIEDLCGYLLHVINEMRIVRPRREEEEYEQNSRSMLLPDGSVGANPLCPNETRLTLSEWEEYSKTGTVRLGNGILTRITREDLLNDDSPLNRSAYAIGVLNRDAEEGEILSESDFAFAGVADLPAMPPENPDGDRGEPGVDPASWTASHPHFYPSAGNQCPNCNATSPSSTGDVCTCKHCGTVFPKKSGPSLYDQKFPQAMTEHRHKSQPETKDITKG